MLHKYNQNQLLASVAHYFGYISIFLFYSKWASIQQYFQEKIRYEQKIDVRYSRPSVSCKNTNVVVVRLTEASDGAGEEMPYLL